MLTFVSVLQYPSCHLFSVRCHVKSPNMHMSHRVTVVSVQEHNAFIGLLDHDDTCHGYSCKNHLFFSDCQRYTLTQKGSCARPPVSNRFRSPGFKCSTADFDNCGTLPITTVGFRPSSGVQHGSPSRFAEIPSSSHVENNFRGTSCNLPQVSWAKDFCNFGRFTTQLTQPHHLTACRLDRYSLCKVLETRQPCIFGGSSCSSRSVHFAAPRSCSAAASAALARDRVWSWRPAFAVARD